MANVIENAKAIPIPVKVGLCLMVTLMLLPVLGGVDADFPTKVVGMGRLVIAELIKGMILGLLLQIFFEAVQNPPNAKVI